MIIFSDDTAKTSDTAYGVMIALIAAIVPICIALGGGIAWFLKWLSERRKDTLSEWRDIVKRQDEHIADLDHRLVENNKRERLLVKSMVALHSYAIHLHDTLVSNNIRVMNPPTSLNELLGEEISDFTERQVQQASELLHAEAKTMKDK